MSYLSKTKLNQGGLSELSAKFDNTVADKTEMGARKRAFSLKCIIKHWYRLYI